jgi:sterol desaturase/sphingolipid hydroxylase (fatty acid hydroxylase superfamily)
MSSGFIGVVSIFMIRDLYKVLFGLITVLTVLVIVSYQSSFKGNFIEHVSLCCFSVFSNLRQPIFKDIIPVMLLYFVFWVVLHERLSHLKIQDLTRNKKDVFRDFVFTFINIVNLSTLGVITNVIAGRYSLIYRDIHEYGYFYAVLSFCVLLLTADAYYYWLHRLLHHKKLFRHLHRLHHLTHAPHPWTTFAMSPIEQLLIWSYYLAFICIVPLQATVLFIFIIFHSARQVLGHLGYEIFHKSAASGWLSWSTTITHHDMHHKHVHCNYGLYFTFWDKLLDTNHPDYKTVFLKFSSKKGEKLKPI